MAIVKHIKSRNADYSAAINYLLFEHDEKNGKKIVDESGRSILRKEFYMDGLNYRRWSQANIHRIPYAERIFAKCD